MLKALFLMLQNFLGNGLARVLTGAGLSLVSYAALVPLVSSMLAAAASAMGGLAADLIALIGLSGLGESVTIIGAAMLTRTTINAAGVGIKKAASLPA